MRKFIFVTFYILLNSVYSSAYSVQKEVFGPDDRHEYFEESRPEIQDWARSTAALISYEELIMGPEKVRIKSKNLGASMPLCPEERYLDQPAAANCSGFLVAPDVIATAGHCLNPAEEGCGPRAFVFDYALQSSKDDGRMVSADSVYFCHEVLYRRHLSAPHWVDLAIVRLDRPVSNRNPLTIRRDGKIDDHAELVIIGYGQGLPVKIAGNSRVVDNSPKSFFYADLDAFDKNSGSAVINAQNGIVEGILVRGKGEAYETDTVRQCLKARQCPTIDGNQGKCPGMESTRITEFFKRHPRDSVE